jgi:hypothetical protein
MSRTCCTVYTPVGCNTTGGDGNVAGIIASAEDLRVIGGTSLRAGRPSGAAQGALTGGYGSHEGDDCGTFGIESVQTFS